LVHEHDSVTEWFICNNGIRRSFETPLVNTTALHRALSTNDSAY
jgi:hypothetical protein